MTTRTSVQQKHGDAQPIVVPPGRQWPLWITCRDQWLGSKARKGRPGHTARAYMAAWQQFMTWAGARGIEPWDVTGSVASDWAKYLTEEENLAASTVNARVAALSSYFSFAAERFFLRGDDGTERPLFVGPNPFKSVQRPRVQAYEQASYPSQAEVQRLLAALDLETARGWRDRAIILGLLTMAQRFATWLSLTGGQIHDEDARWWFEYRSRDGELCRVEIYPLVIEALREWLERTGRWPLPADAYAFTAQDPQRATRLPNVDHPASGPLANSTVNGMLRALARKAGVDPKKVHAYGLRHAGACWMRHAGADVWDLQQVLGHRSVSTTAIYVQAVIDPPGNRFGAEVARQLSQR